MADNDIKKDLQQPAENAAAATEEIKQDDCCRLQPMKTGYVS
jgi:hypothetical protein